MKRHGPRQTLALLRDAGIERDAIESSAKAAECGGPCIVDNEAWSGAEAGAKDVDAAADDAGRTRKSGVEKRPGGEQ